MTAPQLLARGEVHSWWVRLDVPPATVACYDATLSDDERGRSARFRFERDRRRFVVARGALRDLLARYVGTDPGQIQFVYNAFGKPALSSEFGSRLKFNLSHSGDCALIAVAADADVGVDVEQVRALPEQPDVARRFFSAAEIEELNRVPSALRTQAFFRCWTKKEAYGKARGDGLDSTDAMPARPWSLHVIEPVPGYIGALVVEGRGWHFRSTRRVPLPSPSSRPLWHGRPPSASRASPS